MDRTFTTLRLLGVFFLFLIALDTRAETFRLVAPDGQSGANGDDSVDAGRGSDGAAASQSIIAIDARNLVQSIAGDGGDGGRPGGAGGVGGDAFVEGVATVLDALEVGAWGGDGGASFGIGERGGQGGAASVSGSAAGRLQVSLLATVRGGRGGDGFQGADGGDGASVRLADHAVVLQGTDPGARHREEFVAQGGAGGASIGEDGLRGGVAGRGGDAEVVRTQRGLSGGSSSIGITASGGNGGRNDGANRSGDGGNSNVHGYIEFSGESAGISIESHGGFGGGDEGANGQGGLAGDASAVAEAHALREEGDAGAIVYLRGGFGGGASGQGNRSRDGGSATGTSHAEAGHLGTAISELIINGGGAGRALRGADGGNGASVRSESEAKGIQATAEAEARNWVGEIGTRASRLTLSAHASTSGRASAEAWVGGADVAASRRIEESSAAVAMAATGAHDRTGEWVRIGTRFAPKMDDIDIVLHAEARMTMPEERGSLDGIKLSFLDASFESGDFSELTFSVVLGRTVLVEETFLTAESALLFFAQTIDLGALFILDGSRPTSTSLQLSFVAIGGRAKSPFGVTMLLGTRVVPEPGTGLLVGIGLVVLSRRGAKTACA